MNHAAASGLRPDLMIGDERFKFADGLGGKLGFLVVHNPNRHSWHG